MICCWNKHQLQQHHQASPKSSCLLMCGWNAGFLSIMAIVVGLEHVIVNLLAGKNRKWCSWIVGQIWLWRNLGLKLHGSLSSLDFDDCGMWCIYWESVEYIDNNKQVYIMNYYESGLQLQDMFKQNDTTCFSIWAFQFSCLFLFYLLWTHQHLAWQNQFLPQKASAWMLETMCWLSWDQLFVWIPLHINNHQHGGCK